MGEVVEAKVPDAKIMSAGAGMPGEVLVAELVAQLKELRLKVLALALGVLNAHRICVALR